MYNRMFNTAPYNDSRRVVYADSQTMAGQAAVTVSQLLKRSSPVPIVSSGSVSVLPLRLTYRGFSMTGSGSIFTTGVRNQTGAAIFSSTAYLGMVGNYVMRAGGATISSAAVVTVNGKRRRWAVETKPAAAWTTPDEDLSVWRDVVTPQTKGWRKVGM